jgi:hypothetical protein
MVSGCVLNVAAGGTFSVVPEPNNGSAYFNGRAVYAWGIATADCTKNLRFTLNNISRGNEQLLSTTEATNCYLSDIFLQNTCGPLYFPFGTFSNAANARQLTITGVNICAEPMDVYFTIFGDARNSCD